MKYLRIFFALNYQFDKIIKSTSNINSNLMQKLTASIRCRESSWYTHRVHGILNRTLLLRCFLAMLVDRSSSPPIMKRLGVQVSFEFPSLPKSRDGPITFERLACVIGLPSKSDSLFTSDVHVYSPSLEA